MNLPPEFIQTIRNTFGADGEAWLSALPDLIAEACHRWDLTDIQLIPALSYHFVAIAHRSNCGSSAGTVERNEAQSRNSVVLKLGVPNIEFQSEIAALRYYDGCGACRLFDSDAEKGMLLVERLQPGRMLSALADDERAIRIAAELMRQLWRPVPENRDGFIQLKDWFNGFERLRERNNGRTGRLPPHLVEAAETLSRELLTEGKDETLLHGDFHHFNVLESERGWLAIDPKGVIGPRSYELGPLLINPVPGFLNGNNPTSQMERRIAILSEMLGMGREHIRRWGFCHAVLTAWWSIEDNGADRGEYGLRCAEILMEL